jgi:hypothetical protein
MLVEWQTKITPPPHTKSTHKYSTSKHPCANATNSHTIAALPTISTATRLTTSSLIISAHRHKYRIAATNNFKPHSKRQLANQPIQPAKQNDYVKKRNPRHYLAEKSNRAPRSSLQRIKMVV